MDAFAFETINFTVQSEYRQDQLPKSSPMPDGPSMSVSYTASPKRLSSTILYTKRRSFWYFSESYFVLITNVSDTVPTLTQIQYIPPHQVVSKSVMKSKSQNWVIALFLRLISGNSIKLPHYKLVYDRKISFIPFIFFLVIVYHFTNRLQASGCCTKRIG